MQLQRRADQLEQGHQGGCPVHNRPQPIRLTYGEAPRDPTPEPCPGCGLLLRPLVIRLDFGTPSLRGHEEDEPACVD